MKFTRIVDDAGMNFTVNGELLEEIKCPKYLASYIATEEIDEQAKCRMIEARIVWKNGERV